MLIIPQVFRFEEQKSLTEEIAEQPGTEDNRHV